jgi:hypothetical protein
MAKPMPVAPPPIRAVRRVMPVLMAASWDRVD